MAKVLLVDTNFSSGPIYRELLAMGHEVHVVGANPDDCLAKVSSNYWNLNYANTDALANLVERQKFDYLIPGCTDRSYESCAVINRGRFQGLDTPEATKAINNKREFHRIAASLGLPVPIVHTVGQDTLRCPIIVKPVDAFSGKGITIIRTANTSALTTAIEKAIEASPSHEYLIEDYMEGQLYSHTAFLRNMRVLQDFIVREDRTVNPFVVDTSQIVQHIGQGLLTRLRYCAEKLAQELQLVDGLLHTQFIYDGKDFWLIELTRRCPGDLYSQLIELSTAYSYARSYVLPFLGEPVSSSRMEIQSHPIMRHTLTLKSEQHLAFVKFKHAVSIERWVPLSLVGDLLKPSPYSRIAILFCRAPDQQHLDFIYRKTLERDLYEVIA